METYPIDKDLCDLNGLPACLVILRRAALYAYMQTRVHGLTHVVPRAAYLSRQFLFLVLTLAFAKALPVIARAPLDALTSRSIAEKRAWQFP